MNLKKLISIILITIIIGSFPSLFIEMGVDSFTKPELFPPKILFPIVWTILFILMGISAYLATKNTDQPFKIYFIQLLFNSLWSVLFFGLNLKLLSFIWIIMLIVLVMIMIYQFYKESKLAAYLQIPYLLWLFFAAYLNLAIYILNR